MASILLFPWPFASHGLATLEIARTLRSAGHSVLYVSLGIESAAIRDNGFLQEVILTDLLSEGLPPFLANRSNRSVHKLMREWMPMFVRRLESALDEVVAKYGVDLAVVDRNHSYVALPLYGAGVFPVIGWATLPADRRPGVPPLLSRSLPSRSIAGRARSALEWSFLSAITWLSIHRAGVTDIFKSLAKANNFPREQLKAGRLGWELEIPQVVMSPECFDVWPAPHPGRHYLGPCIDFERIEPEFDWSRLVDGRPLALCALGTSHLLGGDAVGFLRRVAEALSSLEGWNVVIAAGDAHVELSETAARAKGHLIVVKDAPQLALLRRADLMITHSGLNSVKECLYFGVPMVTFPGTNDQFGIAARVAHHQVGASGDFRKSSSAEIRQLVARVTSSAAIRQNLERMRQAFVESARAVPTGVVFERLIREARASRTDRLSRASVPRNRDASAPATG
jgi:zeaxanthin glucosyltransferase